MIKRLGYTRFFEVEAVGSKVRMRCFFCHISRKAFVSAILHFPIAGCRLGVIITSTVRRFQAGRVHRVRVKEEHRHPTIWHRMGRLLVRLKLQHCHQRLLLQPFSENCFCCYPYYRNFSRVHWNLLCWYRRCL